MAWFGTMLVWLLEGMAGAPFDNLRTYDDRVRWGTEQLPDAATWGMDAGTQAAIALLEGSGVRVEAPGE